MANQNDGRRTGTKDFVVGVFVIALAAVGLAKFADYMDRNISGNAIICDNVDNQSNQTQKPTTPNRSKRANRVGVVA